MELSATQRNYEQVVDAEVVPIQQDETLHVTDRNAGADESLQPTQ
jgi:hypothetical protein